MIEQTEMVVSTWQYHTPSIPITAASGIVSYTGFDVMRKRASTKKGIACRFTSHFTMGEELLLEYTGENTYVIDFEDIIDREELLKMIRNAFSQFNDLFDIRKQGTVLAYQTLSPLIESNIDLDAILPMLV